MVIDYGDLMWELKNKHDRGTITEKEANMFNRLYKWYQVDHEAD